MFYRQWCSWKAGTQMFGADTAIARLCHTCSPVPLLLQGCVVQRGVFMVFLIFSVHSGKDSLIVSFSSMIRFQFHSNNEGRDGRQRQVKVGMVVSCRIGTAVLRWQCGFTACKYMIVRAIRLNKALFYVLLICICMFIVIVTFIHVPCCQ